MLYEGEKFMEARNFRYLFENVSEGIVHSGCISDTIAGKITSFVYMCGIRNQTEALPEEEVMLRAEKSKGICDIFVLASFSIYYLKKMLRIIKRRKIVTMILPYVTPSQRMALLHRYAKEVDDKRIKALIEHPYLFFKDQGIENIYFLYGNGVNLYGDLEQLRPGYHFELLESRELQQIKETEGYYIPVVKAGYIIENKWIFYFGHYGNDNYSYEQYTKDLFGKRKMSFRGYGPVNHRVRSQPREHTKAASEMSSSTIVMFQSPLFTNPQNIDCVATAKLFTKDQDCVPDIFPNKRNCYWKCGYLEDHTSFHKHKSKERVSSCLGILLLGNVDLGKHFADIEKRFRSIISLVRAITIPGCGKKEFWNMKFLTMFFGDDSRYWICGLDWETSYNPIVEIVIASPRNSIVTISDEFGYCFSGYLTVTVE
jgi:hypothetical protein